MTTRSVWTIGALLQWTADFFARRGIDEPRLSAELLLAHALHCSRMQLYTQYEREPNPDQLVAFRELVKRRGDHVPVAYLVGKAWFFSLEFTVAPDVLIPRPDTETLVEQAITRVRQTPGWETPRVLDLCTGSGCIAVTLAKNLPTATVVATDNSEKALAVAANNAQQQGVAERVRLVHGDLLAAVETLSPPMKFHLVVSNPPYIPTGQIAELMPQVRDHEPRAALDGGPDGLDFVRRIVAGVKGFLESRGVVMLEIGYNQAAAVQAVFAAAGYLQNTRVLRDAAGNDRCVIAVAAE